MSNIVIYHNPRCSKSRQTLQLLEENGVKPRIIEYLNTKLSTDELNKITSLLSVKPRDIMRVKEPEYKENGLDDASLTTEQLIQAITDHPKLLERPIVVVDNKKAAIGRPPENVLDIL